MAPSPESGERPQFPPSPEIPPLSPIPTPQHLAWQHAELLLFVHFGMNTFTGKEWGDGTEAPTLFDPPDIDAEQWVRIAQEIGFGGLIFTAKHHDGFALWPTAHTTHSIRRSPYRDGQGDIVREVAEASHAAGLPFGIYLSPWDRHAPTYGTAAYNDVYIGQLEELLTEYGPIFEVWIDGAHGEGVTPNYDYPRIYRTIRKLQPDALIAISGPDVRWIGNERGVAPETQWSVVNGTWYPSECDVSIRPGWFYHVSEDDDVKSVRQLVDIYFSSVGRNCTLLLNVPPDRDGVLPPPDVERLRAFRTVLDRIFGVPRMLGAAVSASNVRKQDEGWQPTTVLDADPATFWTTDDGITEAVLELSFPEPTTFNVVALEEAVRYGQRVAAYRVEAWQREAWRVVARGTTIGHKRLHRTPLTRTDRVRLVIEDARAHPALREFGLYLDPLFGDTSL